MKDILYPVFGLAFWTSLVLLLIPFYRARAVKRRGIAVDDFKYGESASVPDKVCIPNRAYMNLLEMPMLFYVVCLLICVTQIGTSSMLMLAWAYVALRILHSVIHLTYNKVMHRLTAFAISNVVLVTLWFMALGGLLSNGDV